MTSTAVAVEEVFLLLADLWTRMTADVLARFLWEAIDQEQGRFEREKDGVLFGFGQRSAPGIVDVLWMYCRKRPLSEVTRAEISPERKPMSKAHAIWLGTMAVRQRHV